MFPTSMKSEHGLYFSCILKINNLFLIKQKSNIVSKTLKVDILIFRVLMTTVMFKVKHDKYFSMTGNRFII